MTPLALAVLLVCGSLRAQETPVEVKVRLSTGSSSSPLSARVNATEALMGVLLGSGFKKVESAGKDGVPVLRYTAARWSRELKPAEFANVLVTLKRLWGEDIDFIEHKPKTSQGETQALGPMKSVVPLTGAQDALQRNRAGSLLTGRFAVFYDGADFSAKNPAGHPVFTVQLQTRGLTTEKPGLVLTTQSSKEKKAEPPPLSSGHPYEVIIREEAAAAGMDPEVLRAVIEAKGGFKAGEKRKAGGAYGVMLVTRGAAVSVGMKDADLLDARANIRVGARLLAELIGQFGGDIHRALAAYQVGSKAVIRSGGIPNDREVKYFLGAFERALRSGDPKPEVRPVKPPANPLLRQVAEEADEAVRDKGGSIIPPTGKVFPRDPISRYRKTIKLVAEKRDVDPWLVESVMRAENPWGDPMRVSDAGAIGLMQMMPSTAKMYRVDSRDPVQSIDGGARHLKYLLDLYQGNKVLAVAAYNAGEGRVDERIPNFPETKRYVAKVFGYYEDLTGHSVDYASYMPLPRKKRLVASK